MLLQGALLDETFAAGLAAEGPLAGVYPPVALQSVRLVEAFVTGLTFVRLLPCVYAQVALQVTCQGETLVAVQANVAALPGVDPLMQLQVAPSVKCFPALVALKLTHFVVDTLVGSQKLLQGEPFPTNVTDVWPFTYRRKTDPRVNLASSKDETDDCLNAESAFVLMFSCLKSLLIFFFFTTLLLLRSLCSFEPFIY